MHRHLICLLALCFAPPAPAAEVSPGNWEITVTMRVPGERMR